MAYILFENVICSSLARLLCLHSHRLCRERLLLFFFFLFFTGWYNFIQFHLLLIIWVSSDEQKNTRLHSYRNKMASG